MLKQGLSKKEVLSIWNQSGDIPLLREGYEGFGLLVENDSGIIKDFNPTYVNEVYNGLKIEKNQIFVDCILQKANIENRNGRIYPKELLEREINKYMQAINELRAGGESNHPDSTELDINNIPHRIVKVWWEGDTVYGTLELMVSNSYMNGGQGWMPGDFIAELLKKNYKLGISSRGIGSLKSIRGKNYVQDDFEVICWDLVHSPSTPNAFLMSQNELKLHENVDKIINQNTEIIIPNHYMVTKLNNFLGKNK